MHFTGTTVLRVENGKIAEEIGLDDGATALQQLGILKAVWQGWRPGRGPSHRHGDAYQHRWLTGLAIAPASQ